MTPEQAERRARRELTGERSDRGPLIGLVILGLGALVLAVVTFRQPEPARPTIGANTVPAIHCQEDEVIALTPDGVRCVHVEAGTLEPWDIHP